MIHKIQKLNQDIATVTSEINLLKQDVNKYIDEDELKLKTDILEQGISNSVSKSDFDTKTLQIENILLDRLETMTEEQMNKTNFEKEYEKFWTTT